MSPADVMHFRAAQGWFELGDWQSANDEIEEMDLRSRAQPDVLRLRIDIYSAAKQWAPAAESASALRLLVPDDPLPHIRYAFALPELRRTREAFDALLPVAEKFPKIWVIPYNLACYSCQLGDLVGARDWLSQSFKIGNAKEIRLQASDDPDLAPLWQNDQP